MKMVSAAKLRRAQEAMFAARPYARKMMEVLNSMARGRRRTRTRCSGAGPREGAPRRDTADKGLCGAFNANIIRTATRFLADRKEGDVSLASSGEGAGLLPASQRAGALGAVGPSRPCATRRRASSRRSSSRVHERRGGPVFLVYNEFKR